MSRKFAIAAVVATLVATLVTSPADATHNDPGSPPAPGAPPPIEPLPPGETPSAVCAVQGEVTLSPGLSAAPTQNSFHFVETSIECQSEISALHGRFETVADGWTDGDESLNPFAPAFGYGRPGEDCTQGYTARPADMSATNGPNVYTGHVEFLRRFGNAHVWGELSDGSTTFYVDANVSVLPSDNGALVDACAAVNDGTGLNPLDEPRGVITSGIVSGEARLYLR